MPHDLVSFYIYTFGIKEIIIAFISQHLLCVQYHVKHSIDFFFPEQPGEFYR